MKARIHILALFTLLLTSMLFTSCDTTEFVEPQKETIEIDRVSDENTLETLADLQRMASDEEDKELLGTNALRGGHAFELYQLIEFEVQRIYSHSPLDVALGDKEETELAHENKNMVQSLRVRGRGQGWSEELGRSINVIDLTVNPRTLKVSGKLTIEFFPSYDQVEFAISGGGEIVRIDAFDGPHNALVLETTLLNATGGMSGTEINAELYFLNALELINPEASRFESYVMMMGEMSE